ncbi:MAG: hypothetical protein ACR2O4_06465 [Hyphomicrobiaceae bacterium]
MNNVHGLLPCSVAVPYDDGFGPQTPSAAERITPFQRFASFQFNIHQRAARRRLYGLTFYDPNLAPELHNEDADLVAGKIPVNLRGEDVDIRKRILHINDGPDTTQTMQDVDAMVKLMEHVMPTDAFNQVATLERATQYQAAATVMGVSKRNLRLVRTIDDQSLSPARLMMMYNILAEQSAMELIDQNTGNLVNVDPAAFREANMEFKVSDGLLGIDKLTRVLNVKEVLNSVLQSREAASQIDVVDMINHFTSLLGDHTDFAQFRIESPIDVLPVEQRNAAFQLLQQALQQQQAAEGGQPAAPAAVA